MKPSPLPEIPAALRALMAEIGPRWETDRRGNIERMIAEFSEVLRKDSRAGIDIRRDIAYGVHPRQQVDVYSPADTHGDRAGVLFVHGGAFMDGHRNRTDAIYSNVPAYFARNGVVGINVGYRLGDEAGYPGGTEDIAAVVKWTLANAAQLGVDPTRLFLMGHSAGAAHAASYAYDRRHQPDNGHGLAGLIVLSGRVRAEDRPENPNAARIVAYYGTDDAVKLDDLSPVSHVDESSLPTMVAWGEFENPLLDVHCAELVFRLAAAKKRAPPTVWLAGHNHTSTMAHIGTADEMLGTAMLDFIANPR